MDVIPAVDVLGGKVVRLLRGSYDHVTVYGDDPVTVAGGWIAQGARMVHLVDLDGARSGRPDPRLWESFGRADIPFQAGGGIRDGATARRALDSGADRVVMGTAVVRSPGLLADLDLTRLVVALDVKKGSIRGEGWTDAGVPLAATVTALVSGGCRRAMVTGIDRDGTMTGPDLELLARMGDLAPTLDLIASGGVGDLNDLLLLARTRCEAAIVGRALYEGRFTLAEGLAAASR